MQVLYISFRQAALRHASADKGVGLHAKLRSHEKLRMLTSLPDLYTWKKYELLVKTEGEIMDSGKGLALAHS